MGSKSEALGLVLTEAELQLKVIHLVAIWVEVCSTEAHKPFASKVFLAGLNIIMFITITFYNMCIDVIGFAYQPDARAPLLYLNDVGNWTALASLYLLVVIMWIGDALVIYRCFLIWQRNYRVIAIPSLLYILIVGLQISNLWWISQQSSMVNVTAKRWPILTITFPLYFVQNFLTTGLILFRIWSRHRELKNAGIVSLNMPSLVALMRAIVESAAIYTTVLFLVVVLCSIDHPGVVANDSFQLFILLIYLTGIMFTLMAIRVHGVQEEAKHIAPSPSLLPSWVMGD
ncbi:hypothetical protein BKA70DRAFT_1240457 [Coprinopsis sp. MPI-PUGE-AT-0042]|nr:hypothetical protein BKA70DRAFT_1240457 [Coprinopsis sp. MPI-PUGE-AT-0042]